MAMFSAPPARAVVSSVSQFHATVPCGAPRPAATEPAASEPDAPEPESPVAERTAPRRLALVAVSVLCCGFSYSIGWQKGWSAGTVGADARFNALNETLLGNVAEMDAANRLADSAHRGAARTDARSSDADRAGAGTVDPAGCAAPAAPVQTASTGGPCSVGGRL